jgi:hypothetical protein
MADYGINKRFTRAKVRLQVLIGFNPTEPVKLSSLAPPNGVIKSGQVIKKVTGKFNPTVVGDKTTKASFFIALHDSDDHDVQASGKLVGLDCSDTYELQTGYFTGTTFSLDDALTVAADGKLIVTTTTNDVIVARISAVPTDKDGAPVGNGIFTSGGLTPSATDQNVIQIKTCHTGLKV